MRPARAPIAFCSAATFALSLPHANASHALAFGLAVASTTSSALIRTPSRSLVNWTCAVCHSVSAVCCVVANGPATTQIVTGISTSGSSGTVTSWSATAVAQTDARIVGGRSTPNAITSPPPLRGPTFTLSVAVVKPW